MIPDVISVSQKEGRRKENHFLGFFQTRTNLTQNNIHKLIEEKNFLMTKCN